MFAVVVIAGKQYQVTPGDIVVVDRVEGRAGDTVVLPDVLLTGNGNTQVGAPTLPKISVKAKILSQEKGEKVEVRRFKSKVRFRRHTGFRPLRTKLQILSIS